MEFLVHFELICAGALLLEKAGESGKIFERAEISKGGSRTALVKMDIKPGDSRIFPTFDVCIYFSFR